MKHLLSYAVIYAGLIKSFPWICFCAASVALIITVPMLFAQTKEKSIHAANAATKQRIFIDMDGTLAEFDTKATLEDLTRPKYYQNLAPLKLHIDAVNLLISEGYEVYILSKVLNNQCKRDKNIWLRKYGVKVPRSKRIFVPNDDCKTNYIKGLNRSDILCDDFSRNCQEWEQAGGTALKILNGINGSGLSEFKGRRIRINEPSELLHAIKQL